MSRISSVFVISIVVLALPGHAVASQVFSTDCDFSPKESFNPGDAVCVTGDFDIKPPNKILPEAYVHVIPVGHANPLADVTGAPNLIPSSGFGGAFYDQYVWLPNPQLSPGAWELAVDEYPFKQWGAADFRTGEAFIVLDEPVVLSVDVAAIKGAAAQSKKAAANLALVPGLLVAIDTLSTVADWGMTFGVWGGGIGIGMWAVSFPIPSSYNSAMIAIAGPYIAGMADTLYAKYDAIEKDPPDPNFDIIIHLDFSESLGLGVPYAAPANQVGPNVYAAAVSRMGIQAGAYDALVPSVEKLQGAQEAGNNTGMLIQAEKVKAYAELALASGDAMLTELDSLEAYLVDQGTAGDIIDGGDFQAMLNKVIEQGFSPEEENEFRSFGMTDAEIAQIIEVYAALEIPAEIGHVPLIEAIRAPYTTIRPELLELVAQVDGMIDENGPVAFRPGPQAKIEKPAPVAVGASVGLKASAVHWDPATPLTYRWDTNMDGAFDDGMGTDIDFMPTVPGPYVVSVEVDDGANRDVSHRVIEVALSNSPPEITGSTPIAPAPFAEVGEELPLHVDVVDADGDPVTITWFVDGDQVGQGADFVFSMPDEEPHQVKVVIADDNPYSPDGFQLKTIRAAKWLGGGVGTDTDTESGGTESDGTESGGTDGSAGTGGSAGTETTGVTGGSGGTDGTGSTGGGSGGSASASDSSANTSVSGSDTVGDSATSTSSGGEDGDPSGCACGVDRSFDPSEGLLSLLGFLGLVGLRRRNRHS